ncbi:MAG: asparagine synthase (glutamine-hydrolyzing), partial [Phycisphaerales bacterium]
MCGIAAILNLDGHDSSLSPQLIERMRDRLTHRGPDDSGLWQGPVGSVAHRRLAVIDPSAAGHQPMVSADGRYLLAYNGELYNDHDLRSELASLGHRFGTSCDTETLLAALIQWRNQAIDKLRGMYAFVFVDTTERAAILARDPMGIKPLYHSTIATPNGRQLIVASEISSILEHPQVDRKPDPITLSGYLSSIRTVLGERTMYQDVSTLQPGDWVSMSLDEPARTAVENWWSIASRDPTQSVRQTIEDSVHRHLRTDVPMCTLLSGGLDSAITTLIASQSNPHLHTFCAGAKVDGFSDDFKFASLLADRLGTQHHEVVVDQDGFLETWEWMIQQLGVPLSTPNEVAIYKVASALRDAGHVVALSGEGADELFGGYGPIMQQALGYINTPEDGVRQDPGLFHLRA